MAKGSAPAPRTLFVIDNDFGALATVMYFLHGQPLAQRSTLLLPTVAHTLHGELGVATRPYGSIDDILHAAREEPPAVVVLYSGYLLASQGLMTVAELRRLVRELRAQGCAVATSDPFLGTYRQVAQARVPSRPGGALAALERLWPAAARAVRQARVRRHVRRIAEAMQGLPHVYPAPVPALEAAGGPRRVVLFNPRYFARTHETRPDWLFVLAKFDFEYHEALHGRQGFVERVGAKLREAVSQGRRATFIGPAAAVEALASQLGSNPAITLVAASPFGEFERRLLQAEVAFYWHIFATSAFLRRWNGLPVFFFDAGRVPRLLQPLHEAGLASYYMGRTPDYLDIAEPLDAKALLASAGRFAEEAKATVTQLSRLPAIDDAVAEIARG